MGPHETSRTARECPSLPARGKAPQPRVTSPGGNNPRTRPGVAEWSMGPRKPSTTSARPIDRKRRRWLHWLACVTACRPASSGAGLNGLQQHEQHSKPLPARHGNGSRPSRGGVRPADLAAPSSAPARTAHPLASATRFGFSHCLPSTDDTTSPN